MSSSATPCRRAESWISTPVSYYETILSRPQKLSAANPSQHGTSALSRSGVPDEHLSFLRSAGWRRTRRPPVSAFLGNTTCSSGTQVGGPRPELLDMRVIGEQAVGHPLCGGWHLGKEPADVEPVPGEGVESGWGGVGPGRSSAGR